MTTEIFVCVLCRPAGTPREAPRAGLALFEAVQDAALRDDLPFIIRPVECMSACSRSCTVAFQSKNKATYLFGDLQPDEATANAVLACAQLHQSSTDGFMHRDARAPQLREGILARLPAVLMTNNESEEIHDALRTY